MEQKKEFMLLFRFEPSNDYQPTEVEMNEMHQSWGAFIGNIAIEEKLVSTYQLGLEGRQISSEKIVSNGIYIANRLTLSGNMIVTATSLDEAVSIAKKCPILLVGGTVEVRDIIPM